MGGGVSKDEKEAPDGKIDSSSDASSESSPGFSNVEGKYGGGAEEGDDDEEDGDESGEDGKDDDGDNEDEDEDEEGKDDGGKSGEGDQDSKENGKEGSARDLSMSKKVSQAPPPPPSKQESVDSNLICPFPGEDPNKKKKIIQRNPTNVSSKTSLSSKKGKVAKTVASPASMSKKTIRTKPKVIKKKASQQRVDLNRWTRWESRQRLLPPPVEAPVLPANRCPSKRLTSDELVSADTTISLSSHPLAAHQSQ